MKRFKKILSIVVVVFLCFGIAVYFTIKSESNKSINSIQISNIDLSSVDNGSYLGECTSGPCYAKVKVNVKNQKIDKISILEHKNGMGSKAESIVDDVINKQSLKVDTVSGATISSKVILKSIENAIIEGEN